MSEPNAVPMRKIEPSEDILDGFTREYLDLYSGPDGAGGAPHYYEIRDRSAGMVPCSIYLQHGNPQEVGVNGIGAQTLILVVIDFLQKCQAGPFSSTETAEMIHLLIQTMDQVRKREEDRKARGVYQTHQK